MAKNCGDILKSSSEQLHKYLEAKAGVYDAESQTSKEAWRKAAKELQNETLNNLNDIYADLKIGDYKKVEKQAAPIVESATIEINGKTYEGKNHAEAILKAKEDGQDISQVDRKAQGKFKLSDGTIIDRAEAKTRFGQDRSELLIPQDEAANQANKEYKKVSEPPVSSVDALKEVATSMKQKGTENTVYLRKNEDGTLTGVVYHNDYMGEPKEGWVQYGEGFKKGAKDYEEYIPVIQNEAKRIFEELKQIEEPVSSVEGGEVVDDRGGIKSPFKENSEPDIRFKKAVETIHNKPVNPELQRVLDYFNKNVIGVERFDTKSLDKLNEYFGDIENPEIANALKAINEIVKTSTTKLSEAKELLDKTIPHSKEWKDALDIAYKGTGYVGNLNTALMTKFVEKLQEVTGHTKELQATYNDYVRFKEKGYIPENIPAEQSLPKGEAAKQPTQSEKAETTQLPDTPEEKATDIGATEKVGEGTDEGTGGGKEPPKQSGKPTGEEGERFEDKAIIGRMLKSDKVSDETKEILKPDKKYKVRTQKEARRIANEVIEEFGTNAALVMAESGKFNGDVNSMVFAVSLDTVYDEEQAATNPEEKQKHAERYADIAMRYQDAAESGGRFISAIYDFYKKSPAGLVIKAEKEFQRRQDEYFEGREKPTKEAWQEFINTVEGKELLQEELEKIKPKKKKIFTPDTEAKIKSFFSKLKIDTKGQAGSYLIPPQIYNVAIDIIEEAVLTGVSIGKAIERAVEYIGDNYKDTWQVKEFKKNIRDAYKKQNIQRTLSAEDRERILKKWSKKLIGLNQEQKNTLLNKAFLELIDNGALEYDQFKQLYAEALGLPQMTPELAAQLKELATKINEPSKIKDEILKTKSPELISKYRDAVKDAEIAATKLNDLVGKQKWWLNTFLTVMRLNTLGAVSLAGNIAYNVAALPVRFAVNLTATGIDYLLAGAQLTSDKVFGTSLYTHPPTHNVFKIQGGFLRGLWLGTTTSIKQFFTGLSNRDYFQKEIKQNIKPLTSAKKFIRGMTGKQKLTLNEKLNSFIEAFPTMGMSAEVIARALNIGDKGFRFAAEFAKAEQLAQRKGLKGIDKEIFILFPDEESEQKIRDAGERIVFQQKNVVTKALDSAGTAISSAVKNRGGEVKLLHGIAKTLGYASQPFLNTPLNVFNEFIHYAFPPLPLYRAGKAMVQGDSEKAVYHLSQAVVGLSIGYAATQLVAQGLITGSGDDDEAKERAGIQAFQRQGQINLSGLKRLLAGSYDGVEDDDTWVDLKYYGFMGMILLSKASQYKGKTKEQIEGETLLQDVVGQFVPAVKTGLTEGVFSGTSSLMNAISMGGRYTDNWLLGMGNVFFNAFEPNWLRSLSMANNDYIRDTRGMSLSQEAKNQLKNRFFSGKDLPSKIDIWGEKIESVPEGSNRYLYNVMGLNKKNIFDNDQFGFALYDYYNQTKNYNIFPPVLKREVNNKSLTPEQYEQFSILVGSHRSQLVNPLIQSGKFETLKAKGVDEVVKKLDKIYNEARDLGVKEFENIYPEFKIKKKK